MIHYGNPPSSLTELLWRTWVLPAVFGYNFVRVLLGFLRAIPVTVSERLPNGCYVARGSRVVTVCEPNLRPGSRIRVSPSGGGGYFTSTTDHLLVAAGLFVATLVFIFVYYQRNIKYLPTSGVTQ